MAQTIVELKASDLDHNGGVFCPSAKADMQLWNGHPRVFLEIARQHRAQCPYCGTVYRLAEGEVVKDAY